jgi:hypothetical protein
MRRTALTALTLLAGAFVVLPSSGCDCQLDCDERPPVSREVVGKVTQIEDGVITLDVADEPEPLDVVVYGRASALDVGDSYRVPLHDAAPADVASDEDLSDDLPSANLEGSCDCGAPFITHLDGKDVDTGILPHLPLWKYGWAFLAAASIFVLTWANVRVQQNEPL